MAASIIFDQVGLPAGTGGARTDGLATGAKVTVKNGSGRPCLVQLLWVPPEDTGVVSTLTQTAADTWTFDPTASCYGSYKVRLIEDYGLSTQTISEKVFGVRLPGSGILIPALNEGGDRSVSLVSTPDQVNAAIAVTDNDESYAGFRWLGWWKAIRDLMLAVETLITGGATIPSTLYINDVTGNDSNSGASSGQAIKTFGRLVQLLGRGGVAPYPITVKAYPHGGAGYPISEVAKILGYQGRLVIEGQNTTDVGSLLTVASVSGNVIDFGSPGFTLRAFVGAHLVCITGANAGISRVIKTNDADEIETPAFPNTVTAGDTFRVRLPATAFLVDRETTLVGGAPGAADSSDAYYLAFINVKFMQTNEFIGATFSGQIYFFGVVMVTDAYENFVRFSHGRFFAGRTTFVDSFGPTYTDAKIEGWGISAYKAGAARRSFAQFYNSNAELSGCSFETTQFYQSTVTVRDSEFESSDVQPHGALVSSNSYVLLESGILFDTSGGAYASALIEGGQVELLGSTTQVGATAAPWIVRYPGAAIFNGVAPTLTGAVQAFNGGKVRLVSVTGSTVAGGYQAGYDGLATATSFANAGDYISAADDSSVYRSA